MLILRVKKIIDDYTVNDKMYISVNYVLRKTKWLFSFTYQ